MSKKLPTYLENIIDHMAVSEEKTGGMKREAAREKFRSELISESLTAKANPHVGSNPSIKPFVDIYILVGEAFAASSLGRALGFKFRAGKETISTNGAKTSKRNVPASSISRRKVKNFDGTYSFETVDNSEGKKFLENLRAFAVNVANEVTRGVFGERTERVTNLLTNDKTIKNWFTASSGEYVARGEKSPYVTKAEHIEQFAAEQTRYRKLAVQALVLGLLEPLFELSAEDLDGLVYELTQDTTIKELSTVAFRREFQDKILELMRDRNGIVKATIQASEYVGQDKISGGKIPPTFVNLTVELYKIKESASPVKIVPPLL